MRHSFGLYAARRTRAIAAGELLSLPLFALLALVLGERLTLEWAGVLWLGSYVTYALFNVWALRTPNTGAIRPSAADWNRTVTLLVPCTSGAGTG